MTSNNIFNVTFILFGCTFYFLRIFYNSILPMDSSIIFINLQIFLNCLGYSDAIFVGPLLIIRFNFRYNRLFLPEGIREPPIKCGLLFKFITNFISDNLTRLAFFMSSISIKVLHRVPILFCKLPVAWLISSIKIFIVY